MNIVVTKNEVDYGKSFLKVQSLKRAYDTVGVIDILVYNVSSDSSEEKREYLGKLKDRVKKLVYICSEDKTDLSVKMMVVGSDGKYFDDEFFLESELELTNLVDSLDEVTEIAELGGVNVLSDFLNRYLNNGSTGFNSNYLAVVKEAVNNLVTEYNQKNLEIIQMSETATDIFSSTSSLLSKMRKEREGTQEIIDKLTKSVREPRISVGKPSGSGVFFFPRVNYMGEKSIIRVKELGNVNFLVSFMLGFRVYLENIKHLRPKLIFVEPVGDLIENKYSDFNWVNLSNIKSESNYHGDVVFTNYPSKEVLVKLLGDGDYDTFIVIDRLVSDRDHILNCKGGSVKYAINGENTISKFNINRGSCIVSLKEISGTMFSIPLYPTYPKDKSSRERLYLSSMGTNYEKMILDLRRR